MNILVDTSIWSLVLRRKASSNAVEEQALTELIREGRVLLVGPVRQELLSGVRTTAQFNQLRDRLRVFPDERLHEADFEEASSCYNRCRARGVHGSNTDFLLCAIALRRKVPVFTADKDFASFADILGLALYVAVR